MLGDCRKLYVSSHGPQSYLVVASEGLETPQLYNMSVITPADIYLMSIGTVKGASVARCALGTVLHVMSFPC